MIVKCQNSKRNAIIEIMRFVFAISIFMYHTAALCQPEEKRVFIMGYIGVEYFFVLSGYLMSESVRKEKMQLNRPAGEATISFIWKKVSAVLPYHIVAFFIAFFVHPSTYQKPLEKFVPYCTEALWEFLFVKQIGLGNTSYLNGTTWYMSSLIFTMLIIYPLLYKKRDVFVNIIAPTASVFFLGILYAEGAICGGGDILPITHRSTLRAFSELCLGCIAYEVCQKLQTVKITRSEQAIMSLAEIGCYTIVIVFAAFWNSDRRIGYTLLLLIVVAITLSFSGKTWTSKINCGRFTSLFGKCSLLLFLNHRYWCWALRAWMPKATLWERFPYFVMLTICSSLIGMFFVEVFKQWYHKRKVSRNCI